MPKAENLLKWAEMMICTGAVKCKLSDDGQFCAVSGQLRWRKMDAFSGGAGWGCQEGWLEQEKANSNFSSQGLSKLFFQDFL